MKKLFYILLTLNFTLATGYSQSGWVQQSPLPTGNALEASSFINANTGLIVGMFGTIVKTTNGGNLWVTKPSGTNSHFSDVCFVSQNIAYAVGATNVGYPAILLKTTNAGENWFEIPRGGRDSLASLSFINENTGYVLSTNSVILKTTDGGYNWVSYNYGTLRCTNVFFVNEQTGYIGGSNSSLYKTTNGGVNWVRQIPAELIAITSIYFINSDTGFLAGGLFSSGVIHKTTNGGINWYLTNSVGGYLHSIKFADSQTGYAVGTSGPIKSTDGGENWTLIGYGDYNCISSVDIQTVYIAGPPIVKTTNGGSNWFYQSSLAYGQLTSIFMINESTGYAGGGSEIVKTTNGGTNWLFTGPFNAYLGTLFFINADSGYGAGENGSFIKTTDGGNNWTSSVITSNNFYSVFFVNYNTGFVIGNEIMKTTNAGLNWEIKMNGFGYSIFFVNQQTGYASGFPHLILKTTNGGDIWYQQSIPTLEEIKSIYFINEITGYAASAYDGVIIKTTNGGINWSVKYSGTNSYFNSVYFINENTGFVAGGLSIILKTTNGGDNWYQLNPGINFGIYSIRFTDANTGYVCGQAGIILKTTTGGEPIGVINISSEIPASYKLYQNYPNPFNPKTTIKYDLPKDGFVTFKVYDVLGKELYSVTEHKQAGSYQITLDGSNYASGLYFYRLETGNYIETKKMVLVK